MGGKHHHRGRGGDQERDQGQGAVPAPGAGHDVSVLLHLLPADSQQRPDLDGGQRPGLAEADVLDWPREDRASDNYYDNETQSISNYTKLAVKTSSF